MTKRMLIDANHPEETRVVVLDGTRLDEFDVETSTKKQLKGNIYLARVVRVEPSLQAAFVEYGGNRHGFLAFNEIHPDYYQIPKADREKLIREEAEQAARDAGDDDGGDGTDPVETLGGEEDEEVSPAPRSKARSTRSYKIQEVIKRRQILLVQVVKEERGNKGAALTTYLSLAGRYCVFMPNTTRGGGVSRKITNAADRKRLKSIMGELTGPRGSAIILRTAGSERSKAEIKRDHDYLLRTWDIIREAALASRAPCLIHEEGSLIKRAIRDIYSRDIEEILVEGDAGYRIAKDFMRMLTPSHAKKVQPYRDDMMPLFHRYQVESQMDAMHSPTATLKSGGYIVINQTEALVAIDVNSGRSTRERNIEETAYKTNLEAAEEIARQLRLRDLSGLIVIDFIDMDDAKSNAAVERRLKEALKVDRARIQIGRISPFGLLEMSRQRLRPSLMETSFVPCPHCQGTGSVRSVESTAINMLRIIEEEGVRRRSAEVTVYLPTVVALYILNQKRHVLASIESRYGLRVLLQGDDSILIPNHRMDRVKAEARDGDEAPAGTIGAPAAGVPGPMTAPALPPPSDGEDLSEESEDETTPEAAGSEADTTTTRASAEDAAQDSASRSSKRRRRRRRKRKDGEAPADGADTLQADADGDTDDEDESESDGDRDTDDPTTAAEVTPTDSEPQAAATAGESESPDASLQDDRPSDGGSPVASSRSRRRRRPGREREPLSPPPAEVTESAETEAAWEAEAADQDDGATPDAPPTAAGEAEAKENAEEDTAATAGEDPSRQDETDPSDPSGESSPTVEAPTVEAETEAAVGAAVGAANENDSASTDPQPDPRPRRVGWWSRIGPTSGAGE